MSLWSRLALAFRAAGWLGPYGLGDKALLELFGGQPVSSGVKVDEAKALTSTAVWACVQLIAGTIGTLPLILYRRLPDGGRSRMTDNRLYRVLADTPNDDMAAPAFWETMAQYLLLWGNSFAEIRRDSRGGIAALWPIEPWRVQGERDGTRLRYRIDGNLILQPDEMLHIPGLTPDGVWGYSPIQKAREAVGLLLAAERFGGTFFGQGSNFGGILTHPGRLNDAAETNLRASLEKRAQGVDRAHNFIILQEGMTYSRIGIPPNDAQFLETRQFQLGEIARFFGVPPHMIGDVERSTSWGTGIENQTIGFLTYTLRRWLVRIEKEVKRKLISPLEQNMQYPEFLVDALLRADTQTRFAAYHIGRNDGFLSANDIRRLENMDPLGDEGDMYFVAANMVPTDRVDELVDKQIASATARPSPGAPDPLPRDVEVLVTELRELKALPPPPVADLTPVLAKLEAADQERKAHSDRLASLLPSVQLMIEDVTRDFVRREGDRAKRAAGSPEKLAAWIQDFYPRQSDYAVRMLRGAMQVYTQLVGRPEDTEREIRDRMAVYIRESCDALDAIVQSPPDDLKTAVAGLVDRWEAERPSALARTLLAEAVADAH